MALAQLDDSAVREVQEFIYDIGQAKSYYDLFSLSVEIANHYYFDYICVLKAPSAENKHLDELALISNMPSLPTAQDERNLNLVVNRAFRHARKETGCLHLRLSDAASPAGELNPADGLEDFGLGRTQAYFLTVHSAAGSRGLVGFFGTANWVEIEEVMEMNYLANLIFDRACKLLASPDRSKRLSKREYECLYWTAAGKTSAEIATILELSEHTINNYLAAVCNKLDSVNRVHAVAKAIRQGIIA